MVLITVIEHWGLGLNLNITLCITIIATTFSTIAYADEIDLKSVNIPGVSALRAADILFDRPIEPRATYVVIALGKGPEGSVVSINTRYSHASGWAYTARAVKCGSGQMRTLGSGETVEGMLKSKTDPSWGPLFSGSSATQVAEIACAKNGTMLSGVLR